MASHPGDGSSKEPVTPVEKEKRIPLKEICFNAPTKIPGITTLLTVLTANERRLVDGQDWYPPPMWLDSARREVCIEDRRYPLERVHYYDRLKVAGKLPPPLDVSKYTIGKRK